jgi:hypothetical protein
MSTIRCYLVSEGVPLEEAADVVLHVVRLSDSALWDYDANTFGGVADDAPMTEDAGGYYYATVDVSGWTDGAYACYASSETADVLSSGMLYMDTGAIVALTAIIVPEVADVRGDVVFGEAGGKTGTLDIAADNPPAMILQS